MKKFQMQKKQTYISLEDRMKAISQEYFTLHKVVDIMVLNDVYEWPDEKIQEFMANRSILVESFGRGQDNYNSVKKAALEIFDSRSREEYEIMQRVVENTR